MSIQNIHSMGIESLSPSTSQLSTKVSPYNAQQNFAQMLKSSINSLNEAQLQSDQMTQRMINGENVELHDVMIASQKASVSLNLTMEMRNKAVEAYQEIMRMPV
ncbi:flagellar hook-basal body complex protein FliE [Jeotgalibacillus aurantiacus]|uniref:flagellar hook-basal body complex protein FliE n=1 Tax=Jeotgalibacillus aurantiacus TaxID=2763266 RepID=UPI001D0AC6E1|nr:flagellar hook-basal body complex protein FliE [Jeotgalibacillus aurantiacus]